ncbi:MAG: HisA/HisF-related TIM barrel protein [Candidatus Hodgkinia cicadicola]
MVDLDGAINGFPCNSKFIEDITSRFDGFIQVGGGIRTAVLIAFQVWIFLCQMFHDLSEWGQRPHLLLKNIWQKTSESDQRAFLNTLLNSNVSTRCQYLLASHVKKQIR